MILEADEVLMYDNSYEKTNPTLLFQKFNEGETNSEPVFIMWDVDDEKIKDWVIEHILEPLSDMGVTLHCYTSSEGEGPLKK